MAGRTSPVGRISQLPQSQHLDATLDTAATAATANSALLAAERHLLAALVRDASLRARLPQFAAIDFQGALHHDIYGAITDSPTQAQATLSFLTVAAALEVRGKPSRPAMELEAVVVDASQVPAQAELLLKASRRRQIAAASAAFARNPESATLSAELDRVRNLSTGAKAVTTSAAAADDFLCRLRRKLAGEDPAVSTGLVDLDKILGGGLRGGQVVVLAGRPSEGKSALAQGIAEHVATDEHGRVALFISLEMLSHEIMERRVVSSSRGFVPLESLRSGDLTKEQMQEVERLMPLLSNSRMEFLASHSEGIDGIVATVKARAKRGDVGLVVLDYLQLIEAGAGNASENREQQVAKVCRCIKQLALTLQVPFLLLSQLNREVEKGNVRRRPRMSDLRESGSIEQDADVILFIHDDAPKESRAGASTLEKTIIVEKQRAGRKGVVPVLWLGRECRFANFATRDTQGCPSPLMLCATEPPKPTTSAATENFHRVRQLAAASHGETAGLPIDVVNEVAAMQAASVAAAVDNPFTSF